jgi:hypothetical protein
MQRKQDSLNPGVFACVAMLTLQHLGAKLPSQLLLLLLLL